MKSLSEHIDFMRNVIKTHGHDTSHNDLYDDIDAKILFECQAKFRKEYRHHEYKVYGDIFEAHGIFDKSREFASFITKILNNFITDNENHLIMFICNDIPELKNNYFNIIYVNFYDNFYDNSMNGEYDSSNSKERFIDNKFEYITININKKVDKVRIYSIIEHELNHAYTDLKKLTNKSNSLEIESIKSKYNLLDHGDKDSKFDAIIKDICYLLDKYEQSAYIAEFDGILGDTKFNNIQDAFNKIYDSELYKQIKEFEKIIRSNDDDIFDALCKSYRKVYNVKYSNEKILNVLKKDWNHFWNKFVNHIYQCVCDHVREYATRQHAYISYIGNDDKERFTKYIGKSIFIT